MDTIESKPSSTQRRRRRPQRRRRVDRWDSFCEVLLVVVVIGSVLAIGSVHIQALLVVSALALIGASLELMSVRRMPWPAVILAALGLFSALQAAPLPASWVHGVSPATADVWLRSLIPFGEPALGYFPLSIDPGASIAEALKWLTYAAVYIMATRMRARRGSAWLALLLFGSAVLVTFITLVHGVADLAELYGVYEPNFSVGRWNVGPLLNSNNLAGYAILGLFSGGGLLLSDRSPVPRLPLTIGMGVVAAALCLSGSRGAVASVLIAGVVLLVWLLKGKGPRFSVRSVALGSAPIVIGVGVAIALGTAKEAAQLVALDVHRKVSVWLWSLRMIREHAFFGVGRGAFETAFPPYQEALDYDWSILITHAENFVVQWIAEWGVPVGLCAVILIVGYVLREWYGNRGDRLRFVVMTGLLALLLQNLADLGLEVPAVAIAAVLALAAGERPITASPAESAERLGGLAFIASVPALMLWAAAIAWSSFPVEFERRDMSLAYQELVIKSADERAGFRGQLHDAVLRHPGESFLPQLGSLVAMRAHEGNALPWIARSLDLGPTNGPVHLVLADLLQEHGATTQAMLHLRLAAQYDRTLAGAVGARAPRWAPSIDLLMQAIPDGPQGESLLLDACAKERQPALKIDCFRRAAQEHPRSPQAHEQFAESLLVAIQAGQPPCKDAPLERCLAEADVAIQSAGRLDPKSWRPGYLMSKVLLARGRCRRISPTPDASLPAQCGRGRVLARRAHHVAQEWLGRDNFDGGQCVCRASVRWHRVLRGHADIARKRPRVGRPARARKLIPQQSSRDRSLGCSLAQSGRARCPSSSVRCGACRLGTSRSQSRRVSQQPSSG